MVVIHLFTWFAMFIDLFILFIACLSTYLPYCLLIYDIQYLFLPSAHPKSQEQCLEHSRCSTSLLSEYIWRQVAWGGAHLHAVKGSAAAADDAVAIGTSTAWLREGPVALAQQLPTQPQVLPTQCWRVPSLGILPQ